MSLEIDFSDPDIVADPLPTYERIRGTGRCVWNAATDVWLVTGHADAIEVFRDHTRFSSRILADDTFGPWYGGAATMLGADPPEHDRLRGALKGAFTKHSLALLQTSIDTMAQTMLLRTSANIMADLAYRLPAQVIGELIGVPAADMATVTSWTCDMAVGSMAYIYGDVDRYQRAVTAGTALASYLASEIAAHDSGEANVFGRLLHAVEERVISRDESIAACVLLFLAGTETTAKLLGNAIVLLAEHPEQRRSLLHDLRLVPTAVEEIIRYCGPAQFDPRLVTRAGEFADAQLSEGDVIWVLTAAAGRDPARFTDPQRFDVTRKPNPHLGFGHGVHLCVGAPLARMEATALLRALLRLAPHYDVFGVDYGREFFVRGPSPALQFNFGRGSARGEHCWSPMSSARSI